MSLSKSLGCAMSEATIPGLPAGWAVRSKDRAHWVSKRGYKYRIEKDRDGWGIICFEPEAETGDQLKVSDLDEKWKSKMASGLSSGSPVKFVHGFDAAEATVEYDKKHAKK